MPPAPLIDRFEIREGLARGGMSSVYRAYDPVRRCDVAIKVLHQQYASVPVYRQRFEREARAVAHLDHPNVVRIFDYGGSPDQHLYLVMELIEGPDFGKLVEQHGPLPPTVLTAAALQLASALAHAHDNGIIHRDLKPENVFLAHGRVVLADFGIVKAIHAANPLGHEAASPQTAIIGTPGYMAPEQLEQKPLDERTDWFSFGALLYVLGSAVLPYEGANAYLIYRTIKDGPAVALSDRRPDIPRGLSELVQQCLNFDRNKRPATAAAVLPRLEQTLAELGVADAADELRRYQTAPQSFPGPQIRDTAELEPPVGALGANTEVERSTSFDVEFFDGEDDNARATDGDPRTDRPSLAGSRELHTERSEQPRSSDATQIAPLPPGRGGGSRLMAADATAVLPVPTEGSDADLLDATRVLTDTVLRGQVGPTTSTRGHSAGAPARTPDPFAAADEDEGEDEDEDDATPALPQPKATNPAPMLMDAAATEPDIPAQRPKSSEWALTGHRPNPNPTVARSDRPATPSRRPAKRRRALSRRQLRRLLGAMAVALLAGGGFWAQHILPGSSGGAPEQAEATRPATLSLRSYDKTHVYVDGKPLGTTPLESVPVRTPEVELEVMHLTGGRMRRTLAVEAGDSLSIFVNWARKSIAVTRNGVVEPAPASAPPPARSEHNATPPASERDGGPPSNTAAPSPSAHP